MDQRRANAIRRGFLDLLAQRCVDREYGRRLPRLLRDAHLTQVGADAYLPVAQPAARRLEIANVAQVSDALIAGGYATHAESDHHIAALGSGHIDIATPPLISAWGRRPAERSSSTP